VTTDAPPAFRPLYQQVKERLLNRLIDGTWAPGTPLPSEQQLAQELNVSQGTIRKALDAMTAEHLLVRAQGRGTFVADDGSRQFPESSAASPRQRASDAAQRRNLQLEKGERVWLIQRTRELGGRPVIFESICLPVALFPGLDQIEPIPNNVYALYASRFGLTVGRVTEKLKAILASEADAAKLNCAAGDPLLQIDRIAYSLRATPVEWRVSRCLTDKLHYLSEL
jgi:GntR family transcriptional regulator